MKDYLRFYAAGNIVRREGGHIKDLVNEVLSVYPHIYKLVSFAPPPHEPIMILAFHVTLSSKIHHLKWIIRGFEESEPYHGTSIIIPNEEISFKPDKDRSQAMCFMRLLEVGYHNISLEEFLDMYQIERSSVNVSDNSTSLMI